MAVVRLAATSDVKFMQLAPNDLIKKLEKGTEQYLHHNTMVKENSSVHNVNSKEQDSAQTKEKKTFTG